MSRSRRHQPFIGNGGDSEKYDKQKAHRKFRRQERVYLDDEDGEVPLRLREVSDTWGMNKDGKSRFNAKEHPKLMRK